ncbi:MAG: MerR family transcriptional regulator [Rhizobiaceae bacterium]
MNEALITDAKSSMPIVNTAEGTHSSKQIFKIGDLAREFDVTLRTLRFYEDRGLIRPTRVGTTRLYSITDRERLRIALFCKRIGLTLNDIRKVLELHDEEDLATAEQQIFLIYSSQLDILRQQHLETGRAISDLTGKIEQLNANSDNSK